MRTALRYAYYFGGSEALPDTPTFTVDAATIQQTTTTLGRLQANHLQYPQCFILPDGTTRAGGKFRIGNVTHGNKPLWVWYKNDGTVGNVPVLTRPSHTTEVHLFPVQMETAAGKMMNYQEDTHIGPVNIEESTTSFYAFSQLAEQISDNQASEQLAYLKIYKYTDDTFILVCRDVVNLHEYSIAIYKGDADGQNWGARIALTDRSGAGEPERHYCTHVRNGDNKAGDGKYHGLISYRDVDLNWYRHFHWVTEDFITFSNTAGTFSKDIVTNGNLTPAELETNFTVINLGGAGNQGWVPVFCVSDNGNIYGTSGDGNGGYVFLYYSGGWQQVALDITDMIDSGDTQNGAINDMWAFGNKVSILVRIDDGASGFDWKIYSTTNNGTSWTEEYELFADRTNITWCMLPQDFQLQADGVKFAAYGYELATQDNAQPNYWQPITINVP